MDPKEEAVKQIDHLLNDYGEYPDIFLTDEEKIDKDGEMSAKDPTLRELQEKWRHNKYAATWQTNVLAYTENIFIPLLPEAKKAEFEKRRQKLFASVEVEMRQAITKDTVKEANQLLEDLKEAIT